MNEELKEVRFDKYCKTCEYKDVAEEKDPCHFCLAEPANHQSEKPVNWKEREK